MPFLSPEDIPATEIFPGGLARLVTGENVMFSFLEMAEGAVIPEHSHPEEQIGVAFEGRLYLKVEDEDHVVLPGEVYVVPANAVHSGHVVQGPVKVLDTFGPPRADYLEKVSAASADER